MAMGPGKFGNDTPESSIDKIIQTRKDVYHRKARSNMDLKMKEIEMKAEKIQYPMYPSRPYGLAEEMEGHRVLVWDYIFAHVNDPPTIRSLHDVCTLFRDLVERKYKAARLPEIIAQCLRRKVIPWNSSRTERSNWVITMQNLRILSKATKNAVNIQFNRGMLGYEAGANDAEWVCIHLIPHESNYDTEEWKIPTLMLGALDMEQVRLRKIHDSLNGETTTTTIDSFPMRALIFNERRQDGLQVDLEDLRKVFHKCLEKIGCKITSFLYKTNEHATNTYNNLRGWLDYNMPNLEELMVDFTRPIPNMTYPEAGSFPKCPKLKRFAEGDLGFGHPFINKILEANPTITEILLGQIVAPNWWSEFEMLNLRKALKPLRLTRFHSTCDLLNIPAFFKCNFQWILTLTSFDFLDKHTQPFLPLAEIPSDKLFLFISNMKNLKTLTVMSPRIRDTGRFLNLPELKALIWKVLPKFKSLEFLTPVESLKWLSLDLKSCPEFQLNEQVLELLGKYHMPSLFPALKKIDVETKGSVKITTVWKA